MDKVPVEMMPWVNTVLWLAVTILGSLVWKSLNENIREAKVEADKVRVELNNKLDQFAREKKEEFQQLMKVVEEMRDKFHVLDKHVIEISASINAAIMHKDAMTAVAQALAKLTDSVTTKKE